jgi:hypothetical protein
MARAQSQSQPVAMMGHAIISKLRNFFGLYKMSLYGVSSQL